MTSTGQRAAAILRAWTRSDGNFDDLVDDRIDAEDSNTLESARDLGIAIPGFDDAVVTAAETVCFDLGGGDLLGRLFALPVLVNPEDGFAPEAEAVVDALERHGLAPVGGTVLVDGVYHDATALLGMPLAERRGLARCVLEGEPSATALAVPTGEVLAVVIGLIAVPDGDEPSGFLEEPPSDDEMVAFRRRVLDCGGGVVDVGTPGTIDSLRCSADGPERWIVLAGGGHVEVEDFFNAAAEDCGGEIFCAIRGTAGGRMWVEARSGGVVVDSRWFDPAELPMSVCDLRRAVVAAAPLVEMTSPAPERPVRAVASSVQRPPRQRARLRLVVPG